MFLYRADYYQGEGKPNNISSTHVMPSETEILIQKHRNGKTGSVKLMFQPNLMRFTDAFEGNAPYNNQGYPDDMQDRNLSTIIVQSKMNNLDNNDSDFVPF
jgi:hypothetical protein